MKILLFTGAGATVELGVPAMREMAEQLTQHLRDQQIASEVVERIDGFLRNDEYDIETLIDEVDSIEKGLVNQELWGIDASKTIVERFGMVREEAEWFVPHACERVLPEWASRLWSPSLRQTNDHEVTIATTNYDRSIEIAARKLDLDLDDGFAEFGTGELTEWVGVGKPTTIQLLKLHGSTDWYQSENGTVYKLRHAMPLFGGLSLTVEDASFPPLRSASVLPSREKKVTQRPYPELSTEFRNRAAEAEVAIFVGTSLRDPDIQGVFADCADRIPTYIVSRSANYADGLVPDSATALRQSASRFLASTFFPTFLRQDTPEELQDAVELSEDNTGSILKWIVDSVDTDLPTHDRCKAIENLSSARVALDLEEISEMLESSDETVQIYALGLVQDSPDRDRLLEFAQKAAAEEPETRFGKEAKYLLELAASSGWQ